MNDDDLAAHRTLKVFIGTALKDAEVAVTKLKTVQQLLVKEKVEIDLGRGDSAVAAHGEIDRELQSVLVRLAAAQGHVAQAIELG